MPFLADLIDPFVRFQFMRNSLLAIVLVGIVCAVIGVYVVLRRMAFIGDALAHTILPGIVFAYLNQLNLFIGATVAGLLTALGIGWLSRRESVREDTAIGIMFTFMFALGILLMGTSLAAMVVPKVAEGAKAPMVVVGGVVPATG